MGFYSTSTDYFKLGKKISEIFLPPGFITCGVTLLSLAVFYLLRDVFTTKYNFPLSFIWLIPVVTFLSFISQHVINLIRNEENPNLFMKAVLGRLFLEIGLAIALISGLKMAWEGRITGILDPYGVFAVYAFYFLSAGTICSGEIKKKVIKEELIFQRTHCHHAVQCFQYELFRWFFFLRFTHDHNAEVGVYSIACIFGSIIITLCSALLNTSFPGYTNAVGVEN
ncbi:MAG: hypothetical protein IPJ02_14560 [Chitinophagaceae bacterium]|nr:hypothetical protein [Chitinophagaceae bacterium]